MSQECIFYGWSLELDECRWSMWTHSPFVLLRPSQGWRLTFLPWFRSTSTITSCDINYFFFCSRIRRIIFVLACLKGAARTIRPNQAADKDAATMATAWSYAVATSVSTIAFNVSIDAWTGNKKNTRFEKPNDQQKRRKRRRERERKSHLTRAAGLTSEKAAVINSMILIMSSQCSRLQTFSNFASHSSPVWQEPSRLIIVCAKTLVHSAEEEVVCRLSIRPSHLFLSRLH